MIYTDWFGVLNKKGELMSVDESEQISQANANALETVIGVQTNRVAPVTVIVGSLLDLVVMILDEAKQKVNQKRLAEIAENARAFNTNQKEEDYHE